MKLSEQYEQAAIRNDRTVMIFGCLGILHGALVAWSFVGVLNGLIAVFFFIAAYFSWDMAKIDRMIAKSHRETERRNVTKR